MLEIDLAPQIQETLAIEAGRRGLSISELVRNILGTWAVGEMQTGASRMPAYAPGPLGDLAPEVGDLIKDMGKAVRAMMGQLSCSNCTQRLSATDVEKRSCSKCGAPIE